MIEIIKELDVEVSKPNIFQALVAKQYDMNTRFLKVTLKDSGARIDIPNIETAKVIINANRKDGLSNAFYGVINDDGTVTVPLHSWMLELDGTVICDISVIDTATNNGKKLTTTSFTLIVEKAAYGGEDVISDPQYSVIVQLLTDCRNLYETRDLAIEAADLAKQEAKKAETYCNEALYYRDETQLLKIEAQAAANTAQESAAVFEGTAEAVERIIEYKDVYICKNEPVEVYNNHPVYDEATGGQIDLYSCFKYNGSLEPDKEYSIVTDCYMDTYTVTPDGNIWVNPYISIDGIENIIVPVEEVVYECDLIDYQYTKYTFKTPKELPEHTSVYAVFNSTTDNTYPMKDIYDTLRIDIYEPLAPVLMVYTKDETDAKIGSIEAALDEIISLQENLIGGGN